MLLEIFKRRPACLHLPTEFRIPTCIAFPDHTRQRIILQNARRDLQPQSVCVHTANVSDEEILEIRRFTTHLRVEVHSTWSDATLLEHSQHDHRRLAWVGTKLIGVPPKAL